ncbi:MAG: hypothetical protein R6V72_22255 [Cyclobacterium sp.]|uniref:hypothetical protein n=1 Tax=unclassified Cyclobacterium TaxID=2615055 RepID=UPI0013D77B8A|nr:hypothetical protein [Cyclobacterium sp. SYSU L10401]
MVISVNPKPNQHQFEALLDETLQTLKTESEKDEAAYLTFLGNKLENVVYTIMAEKAKGTPFENSIELISGQKFPDIIANKFFGLEIKTTKQNHWKTTGNSVLEGTRVDGIERIFILFGKMKSPIEFRCKPYEECLSEIVVTHSPRYLVDMNLLKGNTIFDKLDTSYDALRVLPNPIKPISEYYRRFLKPGEEVWWLDNEEQNTSGVIIKSWNNLPNQERLELLAKGMIFFPEIFGKKPDKFNRFAIWLIKKKSIVCPNVRDPFTAGGKGSIVWKGESIQKVPRVLVNLNSLMPNLVDYFSEIEDEDLVYFWDTSSVDNRFGFWVEQVVRNSKWMELPFDLEKYLNSFFNRT